MNDAGEQQRPTLIMPGGTQTVSEASRMAGQLLAAVPGPVYGTRHDSLVMVAEGNGGTREVKPIKTAALPSIIESVCDVKRNSSQGALVPSIMRKADSELISASPDFHRQLPPIHAVYPHEVLIERKTGELVTVDQYDRETGILCVGCKSQEMSLKAGIDFLQQIVQDFNFATPSDRSRGIAAIITPSLVQGGLLKGRAPIDASEADDSQAGKGFRNKLNCAIRSTAPRIIAQRKGGVGSMEEAFSEALIAGAPFICFDNLRGSFDSQSLESFMTEDKYTARAPYLGSVVVDARRTIIMLTTNRGETTPDLANRQSIVRIRKQPEGYKFKQYRGGDILDAIRSRPGIYLGAVHTIVREWHRRGKPQTEESRHDFRVWARTLDYIVQHIMREAPLLDGHREAQVRVASPAVNWVRDLALCVQRAGRLGEWMRVHDLVTLAEGDPLVELPGREEASEADDSIMLQATGRKLAKAFNGSTTSITIAPFTVERGENYDTLNRRYVRSYLFNLVGAPNAADPSGAAIGATGGDQAEMRFSEGEL